MMRAAPGPGYTTRNRAEPNQNSEPADVSRIKPSVTIILTALLSLGILMPGHLAHALTAEWQKLSDRERLELRLEPGDGKAGEVERTGLQSLSLKLDGYKGACSLEAPVTARLFGGATSSTGSLDLRIKDAGFGFIVSYPAPDVINIDLFTDVFGKSWKPDDNYEDDAEKEREAVLAAALAQAQAKSKTEVRAEAPKAKSGGSVKAGPADAAPPRKADAAKKSKQASADARAKKGNKDKPAARTEKKAAKAKAAATGSGQSASTPEKKGPDQNKADTDKALDSAVNKADAEPVRKADAAPSAKSEQVELTKQAEQAERAIRTEQAEHPGKSGGSGKAERSEHQFFDPLTGKTLTPVNAAEADSEAALLPANGGKVLLPAWRPLNTPLNYPPPPLPPLHGLEPDPDDGVGAKPLTNLRTKQRPVSDAGRFGQFYDISAVPEKSGAAAVLDALLSLFTASTAYAAEEDDSVLLDADFAYRGYINHGEAEDWPEGGKGLRLPIKIRVPKSWLDSPVWSASTPSAEAKRPAPPGAPGPTFFGPVVTEPGESISAPPGAPARPGALAGGEQSPARVEPPLTTAGPAPERILNMPGQGSAGDGPVSGAASVASGTDREQPVAQAPAQPQTQLPVRPDTRPDVQTAQNAAVPEPPRAQATPERTAQAEPPLTPATPGKTEPTALGNVAQAPAATAEPVRQAQQDSGPADANTAAVAEAAKKPNVVYVDEAGNPVPAPLDPKQAAKDIEQNLSRGNPFEAFGLAMHALRNPYLTPEEKELFLHRRADAVFALHQEDPVPNYKEIVDSTVEAVNFNTKSPRNAAAYLRLGYVNLKAKNAYEAAAYFTLLRRQFPEDEGVPLSYYYWGDYQYEQGNYPEAAEQFNYVVRQFPDSRYSRDAALGLTRTYYNLGYFEQAYRIIEYVEQRWPSFYLDYPPVLSMMGDVSYRTSNLEKARQAYWLYYNINPDAPDADVVLTRLGDIYYTQKYNRAAAQVYEEAVQRFPAKDGGVISLMRLAEEGIYDDPTINTMFRVFNRKYNMQPVEAYRKIIKDYQDSPLVPLAQLKLAIWSLHQKDFVAALDLCTDIITADPNSDLAPRAREVALNAFSVLATESTSDKRYNRMREIWLKYPILQVQQEYLDPETRLALGVSNWGAGRQEEALQVIEPLFLGHKIPEYSEMALILALTILLENDRWNDIEVLANKVSMWELTPETGRQLDYAKALAFEKKGDVELATPVWKRLHEEQALPPVQQAYVEFFLAKAAEKERDLESAYYLGQESLRLLTAIAEKNPADADTEKIKSQLSSLIDISEAAGLLQDSLDYTKQFLEHVEPKSSDYQLARYRMARIFKKQGNTLEWEKILEELARDYPNSLYGQSASSELRTYRLTNRASSFSPTGGI